MLQEDDVIYQRYDQCYYRNFSTYYAETDQVLPGTP